MSETRFVDIETRLAYQEHTLQSLNEVVCRQQDQIDLLQAQLVTLKERVASLQQVPGAPPDHEIPPHY